MGIGRGWHSGGIPRRAASELRVEVEGVIGSRNGRPEGGHHLLLQKSLPVYAGEELVRLYVLDAVGASTQSELNEWLLENSFEKRRKVTFQRIK